MSKVIDYYLSLNSPYAYLGSRQFAEIVRKRGAEVRVKPVDYGVIFPESGGLPLAKRAPARQAYRLVELQRWSEARDMPICLHPKFFPAPEQTAACAVIAAAEQGGNALAFAHAILRAVWAEEADIADAGTLDRLAGETGHLGLSLMVRAFESGTRRKYEAYTAEALERGVFGAPTYVYRDILYWGQDRLEFLDQALAAK